MQNTAHAYAERPAASVIDPDLALLAGFLRQTSPAARTVEVRNEPALLSSGILDSLGILQLSSFLGEELGIEVSDDDFTIENFETVGSVLAFIRRRRDRAA